MKTVTIGLKTTQIHCDGHRGQATLSRPTYDEIAERAYEIYIDKGHRRGQCERNWQQAEKDLRVERKALKSLCGARNACSLYEGFAGTLNENKNWLTL